MSTERIVPLTFLATISPDLVKRVLDGGRRIEVAPGGNIIVGTAMS